MWAKAMGYTGAAWTEADAVEVGGSTADNQIIEYTFLGGRVRHYKMVGANHVTEPRNSLAKQILLDIITAATPASTPAPPAPASTTTSNPGPSGNIQV